MTGRIPWLALLFVFVSCGTDDTAGVRFEMRDPAGLIDMLDHMEVRLLVLPAAGYTCNMASGRLTPEPPDIPSGGMPTPDAVADVTIPVHMSAADTMVHVDAGDWIILVRGHGTDRVTMVPGSLIASACAPASVMAGGTQSVSLTLVEVTGMGVCGDHTISPDEQCDDGNTTSGDGCSSTCETEAFQIDNAGTCGTPPCTARNASVSWPMGGRAAIGFESTSGDGLRIRMLSETGAPIATGALALDRPLLQSGVDRISAAQSAPIVASNGTRIAASFTDIFPGTDFDTCVRFRDVNLTAPAGGTDVVTNTVEPAPAVVFPTAPYGRTSASMGSTQDHARIAQMSDGTSLVVFENSASTSGLSGRIYAAGMTEPGAAPFVVGTGAGGTRPAVAVVGTSFVVAYGAGTDIHVQRVSASGMTSTPVDVATDPGDQGAPTIAAFSPCPATGACAIVAWHDATADGDGGIRARLLDAMGAPSGTAFTVNTTTTGDQIAPTAAAGNMRFVVAYNDPSGVRARNFDPTGMPALNRSRTPPMSTDDYAVANGDCAPGGLNVNGCAPSIAIGGTSSALLATWQTTDMHIHGRLIPLP